jgi:phospholipase/lecithinase/hemolysin
MFRHMRFCVAVALLTFAPAGALAGTITSIVVYGDSLSDNGNLFGASGQPAAPYWDGRFSDGKVAVEYLAALLNVPLHDFAWAGATTGIGNVGDNGNVTTAGAVNLPGMLVEFNNTSALVPGFAGALFIVWGGPNDFLAPSPLDATPAAIISRSVTDLVSIVAGLQALGATNILVPGMPDLGLTPFVMTQGPAASSAASAYTDAFNAALVSNLPAGVKYFDTASVMRAMVANPAAYGFVNVDTPCFNGSTVCANPDQYLFWDSMHPTTASDALLAADFASAVIPEPSSFVLIAAGLFALKLAARARPRS